MARLPPWPMALACLGLVSCGPKGFSPSEYQAAHVAIDAIGRMYEYADKGAIYYEERKRDAESAASAFPDVSEDSEQKRLLFKISAKTCIMKINIYRTEIERESDPPKRTKAGGDMADYDFNQAYYDAAKCVQELPSLLPEQK